MLTGTEKLLFQSLNLQAFFKCPRHYLFMWKTMSDVLGPGTSEQEEFWASGGAESFHPRCWMHGFNHSEITTVWVCSSPQ